MLCMMNIGGATVCRDFVATKALGSKCMGKNAKKHHIFGVSQFFRTFAPQKQ